MVEITVKPEKTVDKGSSDSEDEDYIPSGR
jgi:hypothetical protein